MSDLPFGLATPDGFALRDYLLAALGSGESAQDPMIRASADYLYWNMLEGAQHNIFTDQITSLRWLPPCVTNVGTPTGGITIPTNTGETITIPAGQPGQVLSPGDNPGDPPQWVDNPVITDHGALTGLADDDHSQYWNDTRGGAAITAHAGDGDAHHAESHTHGLAEITDEGALAALDAVTAALIDSGAATDGQVLTADGAGNSAFEDAAAGRVWPANGELRDGEGDTFATVALLVAGGDTIGYVGPGEYACVEQDISISLTGPLADTYGGLAQLGATSGLYTLQIDAMVGVENLDLRMARSTASDLAVVNLNNSCRLTRCKAVGENLGGRCDGFYALDATGNPHEIILEECIATIGAVATSYGVYVADYNTIYVDGGQYLKDIYVEALGAVILNGPRVASSFSVEGPGTSRGWFVIEDTGEVVYLNDIELGGVQVDDILTSADTLDGSATDKQLATAKMIYEQAGGGGGALGDLSDVDTTGAVLNYVLTYNDSGVWVPQEMSLVNLEEVALSSPADNEVLAYDLTSDEWINQTPAEAGLAEATHTHNKLVASDGSPDPAWSTDADGHLYGALGLKVRANRETALASTMYAYGNIEALASTAGGGYPTISWHRSGAVGVAVYAVSNRADQELRVRDSSNRDWPISRHHGVCVYRNSNLGLGAGAWTTVTFTTNLVNDGSNHPVYWDGGTALYGYADGWYLAHFYTYVQAAASVHAIRFGVNGTYGGPTGGATHERTSGGAFTGSGSMLSHSWAVYLTYGSYVQVQAYVNVAGTLYGGDNAFSLIYLGQ